jgi:hypothetical protein
MTVTEGFRCQKTEDRRQKTEDRSQRTEIRGQKAEDPSSLSELRRGKQKILNSEVGMRPATSSAEPKSEVGKKRTTGARPAVARKTGRRENSLHKKGRTIKFGGT